MFSYQVKLKGPRNPAERRSKRRPEKEWTPRLKGERVGGVSMAIHPEDMDPVRNYRGRTGCRQEEEGRNGRFISLVDSILATGLELHACSCLYREPLKCST